MKRSIPTGAWIAGGLVAAAMLVPGVAYAAATMTQIVGTNGTTVAQVSTAHQLLVAPAGPSSEFSFNSGYSGATDSMCMALGSMPAGKALIVTDVRYTVNAGSAGDTLFVSNNSGCGAGTVAEIALTPGNGEYELPAGMGISAAGGGLSFHVKNTSGTTDSVFVTADGYTVPSTVVP
jgi:hypothetical protein